MTDIAQVFDADADEPTESEMALAERIVEIERNQLRTNRLLLKLQMEARSEAHMNHAHLDAIGAKQDVIIDMLKKLASNGHG